MSEENNDDIRQLVHDARTPLNRISMHAELIKIVLDSDMPKEKAVDALDKIVAACKECSEKLQDISEARR